MELKGKECKLFTKKGHFFSVKVNEADENFLYMIDLKTNRELILNRSFITQIFVDKHDDYDSEVQYE